MPLILGSQSAVSTGYSIDNSCRFNEDGYLTRTPSSSGDPKTFTISCWLKRGNLGAITADQTICTTEKGSGYRYTYPYYLNGSDDKLYAYGGTYAGGSPVTLDKKTVAVFRDCSAWFHYYFVYDTTESVAADRIQLYINGTQITDAGVGGGYSPNTIPGLNVDSFFGNTTDVFSVAAGQTGGSAFDGYMAEFIFVDGTVPAVTEFGEFDEDSPTIWKPKDPGDATITWGTNGLWLDFKDSAALGNDVSGNNNDMTANTLAAADQATDTPTNNFCTLNPTDNYYLASAFTEGNCKIVTGTTPYGSNSGTIALSAGKWYFESKVVSACNTTEQMVGISAFLQIATQSVLGGSVDQYSYYGAGSIYTNGSAAITGLSTYTTGDIISIAFDLENNFFYAAKNGTWENSADPESGATGTGGQAITAAASQTVANNMSAYVPGVGDYASGYGGTFALNFGGCSGFDVTSANQDGNGYGNFEYAVPSGYLAICTKNLGSDGG